MRISSPAFEHEGDIPARFTCAGEDISPPLLFEDVPPEAVSLVLVMDDPDAPMGTWDHWVAYDIEPLAEVPEGVGSLGTAGTNSWGHIGYGGPCPPSGTHRYQFQLFALDRRSAGRREQTRRACSRPSTSTSWPRPRCWGSSAGSSPPTRVRR